MDQDSLDVQDNGDFYRGKNMPHTWIALNAVKGLGPVRIHALLEKYGAAKEAFNHVEEALSRAEGAPVAIDKKALLQFADDQLRRAQALRVDIVTLEDKRYPAQLREIYAPPPVLYVKGDCSVFTQCAVAVVGTRRCTTYGKSVTTTLVKDLVAKNLVVVSGLALGIDTVAHRVCLENKGKTVAVLGCGIDNCYPKDNQELLDRIVDSGAALSEFALGTRPEHFNFPRRNRIISGCCAGVVVVEAPAKSGSLITANYALQQGREVFAVPGSIFSDNSTGPINLIKQGAVAVSGAADILENIQYIVNTALSGAKQPAGNRGSATKMQTDLLSLPERAIFNACTENPARIDELAQKTGKAVSELFDILLSLELKGLIRQVSGQQYVRYCN